MKLALFFTIILFCSCNYSYKFNTKENKPVNDLAVQIKIVKVSAGYEYYTNDVLVNEFTENNCSKEEMELLEYIYKSSLEESENVPKEKRTKPKIKIVTELLK